MQVKRILETSLYVDDLTAAESFYRQVLGLQPFTKQDGRHLFFRCGDAVFLLFNAQEARQSEHVPAHGASGAGHVAFRMDGDEIDRWRDHLRRHNVKIEQEIDWGNGGYSLYFRDPAGNSLELATPQTWGIPADETGNYSEG
ncbi:MAG: glyoxalase/bleomycin resistance/extradiol dioxygenase family protein [Gemmatimonadetes bacterium]|nr:MAG: glyoxalase/bleomycin resistance/extradiol dioxygenase family protein [Gemmatimonadota bacterium]